MKTEGEDHHIQGTGDAVYRAPGRCAADSRSVPMFRDEPVRPLLGPEEATLMPRRERAYSLPPDGKSTSR